MLSGGSARAARGLRAPLCPALERTGGAALAPEQPLVLLSAVASPTTDKRSGRGAAALGLRARL